MYQKVFKPNSQRAFFWALLTKSEESALWVAILSYLYKNALNANIRYRLWTKFLIHCLLSVQSTYNVTNNNFVAVNANDFQVDVTVMFYQKMVLNQKFVRNQRIGLRSTQQVVENFNITLNKSLFPIDYCKPTPQHDNHIFMKFQTTFNFTLMAQTDQQVVTEYFRIDCNPEDALDAKKSDVLNNEGARVLYATLE